MAIAHIQTEPKIKKALIVCLKGNIKTWKEQLDKWTDAKYTCLTKTTSSSKLKQIEDCILNDDKYLILNYDCIRNDKIYETLQEFADVFDVVVFDESSEIKNSYRKGKRTRHSSWYKIIKGKIELRIAIDGEPITESEFDIFGQYKMIDGGVTFGRDFTSFRSKYFFCINKDWHQWILKPGGETAIRKKMRETSFRCLKKNCLDLPPVTYQTIYAEMEPDQKKQYKEMKKWFELELEDGEIVETKHVITQIQKLQQITSGFIIGNDGKVTELNNGKGKVLKNILYRFKNKKKLVIWCTFTKELDIVSKICENSNRKVVRYHGGMSQNGRTQALEAFTQDRADVFIGQVRTGVGLNDLVVSDTCIYYSNSFFRRSRIQSEGRLDRGGQKSDKVTIIDIVVDRTIDSHIVRKLADKQLRAGKIIDFHSKEALLGAING